jgi:energy-coupling factor transporter ATP-binding protein EcfA2
MSKVINYYDKLPKKKVHNPGFKEHGMELPFRGIVVGPSGSGKSNLVLNIIHLMKNTFEFIQICTMDADEPLYKHLRDSIDPEHLGISEGFEKIPPLDAFKQYGQSLIIFDDLCSVESGRDKKQAIISDYYKRGRKIQSVDPKLRGGISMMYLSQSFYGIPKFIRIQANYIFIKKTNDARDLSCILKDSSIGIKKAMLESMYHYACDPQQGIGGFLYIAKNEGTIKSGWDEQMYPYHR